ncbi:MULTISPECIES: tRNA dihydrouridine synthase [Clostridium]|uniref:tRNA dihydrouridine synthase n=1 Tax=Clostridium TaxID=1485 RepID=UPI00069D45C7|nr:MULTISPECIES: tRNA-dihydrouridine synthase family protein [Clostridium]KOF57695.1 diguanylate cyclase [Clostridium sp. DMHC 10]MCD2348454.1 tRNA-dihydrouridine synthase family protein [Clostridium guangxiense]
MEYYLAPMEGITGHIYRNSYNKFFGDIDKYFTPFITPNESTSLKTKELRDLLPENNKGINVVPQILTNNSQGFITTCRKLQELDYKEVNLNLGCPSRTVVSKNRGSGFLAKREELDAFLDEIFKINNMKISIKTRIGKDNPEEFYELIKIFNKYPVEELIIHPRTQKDFYKNKPNLEVFEAALSLSVNPVCYNGDIFTANDHDKLIKTFPKLKRVMLGRGIIANPALVSSIKNGASSVNKKQIKAFIDEILSAYIEAYKDNKNAMLRMKELWGYMIYIFSNNKKYAKNIKKAQKLTDYNLAVSALFAEQDIVQGAGLFYDGNQLYD